MKTLEELIRELRPQLQNEVRKYAQDLVDTKVKPKRKYLRMDWVGGVLKNSVINTPRLSFKRKRWNGGEIDEVVGPKAKGGSALCRHLRTGSKAYLLISGVKWRASSIY